MKIRIGCSGFSYKEWKTIFYPEGLPAKEWLSFYCRHFNSLELNSSFYRTPTLKSIKNWYQQTPDDFLFSVKAPRLVTHLKKFKIEKEIINDFYQLMQGGLEHKLGCILFQMPPSFTFTQERLELIIEKLDHHFKNVVEFRHKSWWTKEVFDGLEKYNITFSGESFPGDIPDTVVQNTSLVYYRFHGKPILYKSQYSEEELQLMFHQVDKKTKELFIYFNNTWGESALNNARKMQEITSNKKAG